MNIYGENSRRQDFIEVATLQIVIGYKKATWWTEEYPNYFE